MLPNLVVEPDDSPFSSRSGVEVFQGIIGWFVCYGLETPTSMISEILGQRTRWHVAQTNFQFSISKKVFSFFCFFSFPFLSILFSSFFFHFSFCFFLIFQTFFSLLHHPHHPLRASHCPLLQYVTCRLSQLTHITTATQLILTSAWG